MNYKLLPAAIAAASVMASSAYAGDITVYGKVNVSLNTVDYETNGDDQWELSSNASRVGVKGSIAINDNLKAIYKAEYQISVDGDDDEFSQRNIYGGFQGNWGTLLAGKHDTPTKMAQGKVDRFNDLDNGDIKNIFAGENRVNNIIMYKTPNMNGFSVTAAVIPGEGSDGDDGVADGTSIALSYKNETFSVALANDSDVGKDGERADITRLVAEIKVGDGKIGALIQDGESSDSNDDIEQDGYLISGEYPVGSYVFKAQYGTSDTEELGVDLEATQIALGVDYKLNKSSKLFGYYSNIEYDEAGAAAEDDIVGIGYEIKF
ncbi:MAG: porin [Oceanicoccus sp.]|uniref:porin n=1 Tax=Oceanicoccus sp. TaxID=2691044 RepID=UPI002614E760|nr:porin [Oceanicoccus sp.]MDG1773562.1 porin [Oceanicoccus sp.]